MKKQNENNGNLVMWMAIALALVCLIGSSVIIKRYGWPPGNNMTKESPVFTPVEKLFLPEPEPSRKDGSAGDLAAKPASYKLVVGANPTVNQKQIFAPPTNSVVITNQVQLDLLTKQAKESRQQAKK